jgi:O-antigen/teichoic acid export membrane protein
MVPLEKGDATRDIRVAGHLAREAQRRAERQAEKNRNRGAETVGVVIGLALWSPAILMGIWWLLEWLNERLSRVNPIHLLLLMIFYAVLFGASAIVKAINQKGNDQ